MEMKTEAETDHNDVMASTSFPSHLEIVLPMPNFEMIDDEISSEKESKPINTATQVPDDYPRYAQITMHETIKESHKKSPTSIYALSDGETRKLALKSREISTRQCKFDIGEEWEQFQFYHNKSVSCPPSPLGGRNPEILTGSENPGYAASEPGADFDAEKSKEPFPFHFLFSSPSGGVKEHQIISNPFNKLNHKFHSTLQCPCFLFFFFLCCLPGVHFMQQSDQQFKKGNRKRARNYGKISTGMYILGSIVGVTFLAVAIYFAAEYVRQFV